MDTDGGYEQAVRVVGRGRCSYVRTIARGSIRTIYAFDLGWSDAAEFLVVTDGASCGAHLIPVAADAVNAGLWDGPQVAAEIVLDLTARVGGLRRHSGQRDRNGETDGAKDCDEREREREIERERK